MSAITNDFKSQSIAARTYILHIKTLFKKRFQFNDFLFKLFNNKQIIYINFNDHLNFIINKNAIICIEIERLKKVDESVILHSRRLFFYSILCLINTRISCFSCFSKIISYKLFHLLNHKEREF